MEPLKLALDTSATVDAEKRVISGKIAVLDRPSSTVRVILRAQSLRPRQPLSRVKLLTDHDQAQPVGYMLSFDPVTLDASFKVAPTPAGDKALEDAKHGLRDGLSIGANPEKFSQDRDGNLVVSEAELFEVSLVSIPDFEDAQVQHIAASLQHNTKGKTPVEPEENQNTEVAETDETDTETSDGTETTDSVSGSSAPVALSAKPKLPTALTKRTVQLTAMQQFRRDIAKGGKNALQLALDPIIQSDVYDQVTVPQFLDELWKGRGYVERFTGLAMPRPLTAQEMTGWRWSDGKTPKVDDYEGNLAEVPTNEVKAEAVKFSAKRLASGHKVDRIHVDMPNPAFWESFYRERAQNYSRLMDGKVLSHLLAEGNSISATAPTGSEPWRKLFRGAQHVLEFAVPDWAIIGADLYEEMALTVDSDKLAFLNAQLGLESGSLANFKLVPAPISRTDLNGTVVVGCTPATEYYTLPGSPIRVDALDVAHGGVDAGLFGYYGLFTTDKRGVVRVSEGA